MSMIVITWDQPSDRENVKAMEKKSSEWRSMVLKQTGVQSFRSFVHPFGFSTAMVREEFASVDDAQKYMASPQWAQVVSEMTALGATNIKAELWKADPALPSAINPQ